MEKLLDVSIIIVNWNTETLLRECLESIRTETHEISYEIIVTDNASVDHSVSMVKEKFPEVVLIENSDNRGFAAANNQGLARARGRYLLLLNSDTLVLDNAVEKTVEFADANPQYGVVGCQVWEDESTIQNTCFRFHSPWNLFCVNVGLPRIFPRSALLGGDKMYYWDRTTAREVDVVSGMFMLVRRDAFLEVGLLDERFFIYCEEADWCYRMRQAGWRCFFWPGARIIHRDGGGKSTGQVNVKMEVEKVKSLLFFIRKHYGLVAEGTVRILIALCSIAKIFMLLLYWPIGRVTSTRKISKFAGVARYCVKHF